MSPDHDDEVNALLDIYGQRLDALRYIYAGGRAWAAVWAGCQVTWGAILCAFTGLVAGAILGTPLSMGWLFAFSASVALHLVFRGLIQDRIAAARQKFPALTIEWTDGRVMGISLALPAPRWRPP